MHTTEINRLANQTRSPANQIAETVDDSLREDAFALEASRVDDPLLECLVTLGKIHHKPLSKEALISGLPLVDNQLTPKLFLRSASNAGFSARIVNRSFKAIPSLTLPAVLILKENRAMILVSKNQDGECRVILPETGSGESTIQATDIEREYAGVAIFVKPEFDFDTHADSSTETIDAKNWFWGTLWKYRKIYANVLLAAVFINVFAIAGSLFVMNVYDRVIPNNAIDTLWVLASGVCIVYVFDFLMKSLRGMLIDKAGKNADILMSTFIFQRIMGIKMQSKPNSAGSFANQVKGYESLREFFTSASLTTIIDLPFVCLFLIFMGYIAGWIAFIPCVAILLILGLGCLMHIPLKRAAVKSHGAGAQKHAILVEAINGFEAIRGLSAAGSFQKRMEDCLGKTARSEVISRRYSSIASNFTIFITQMVSVVIIVVSVFQIQAGDMSMGALIGCMILTGRAMAPIGQVAALLSRLQGSIVSLSGLNDLIKLPQEREEGRDYVRKPDFEPRIEFSNVTFSYNPESAPAIINASFSIKPGERVAILGRVGSGKSTLLRLILGFYPSSGGMITINDTDIRQIDPADLRRRLGYIGQDNLLFQGTLKSNIIIGAPWMDEAAVLEAAKLSGVERFASRHPLGYDLQVGERGELLSGGQRQAVNIARALLAKPSLLVMDEPTCAMDANAERDFISNMEKYSKDGNRTLILSTHKPSMLKLADRIIVMDQGKVAADGPKADVLRQLSGGAGKN
ncbi:type I secretion system permease/ATPase [Candidatus Pelagisphaera phototrophica]|uniref:type I secretion system permease/ATPase n=1 Tax=Candidatus Pelagisphaera phototrophica TaxID=2684113 RepID=UPI001A067E60|nr:type I secretion system permease/ATPase [Candidatus Pelagisphaera phototrophica]QXD33396.1 type I secretion system permease/ATPase [Candidatus Pelagisphaera phototrophica]